MTQEPHETCNCAAYLQSQPWTRTKFLLDLECRSLLTKWVKNPSKIWHQITQLIKPFIVHGCKGTSINYIKRFRHGWIGIETFCSNLQPRKKHCPSSQTFTNEQRRLDLPLLAHLRRNTASNRKLLPWAEIELLVLFSGGWDVQPTLSHGSRNYMMENWPDSGTIVVGSLQ